MFTSRGLAMFSDWHLWRLAWLIDQGVYSGDALAALRRDLRESDDRKVSPSGLAFQQRLFGADHPYAQARPGRDAFAAIRRGQLEAWRRNQLSLDGATLIVSGGFMKTAMHQHVVDLFGAIGARPVPARTALPRPRPAAGPSWIGTREPDAAQVSLYVSFTAGSDRDRDHAARRVLAAMIDDRLRVVREGMGASYGTVGQYASGAAGGTLTIETALDPARAPRAAAAVMAELTALRGAIGASDFVRARRRLVSNALATSRDADSVADELARVVREGGDLRELDRWAGELAGLTIADVAAVAALDLDRTRMVVSVDGPPDAAKATLDALGATDVAWFDE